MNKKHEFSRSLIYINKNESPNAKSAKLDNDSNKFGFFCYDKRNFHMERKGIKIPQFSRKLRKVLFWRLHEKLRGTNISLSATSKKLTEKYDRSNHSKEKI